MTRRSPEWLRSAVFYEIYPQSYMDSNGDGIGDLNGIISKLDYIRSLGCNALWINPCYDSPFKDAGYDVRDYKTVASRYGTNEDLYRLFREAHKRGIRVLLDLVPGHTSEEHPWFIESGRAAPNEYSERYIWTDFWIRGIKGRPYIGGECERNGVYMLNFFKCQPALNYGFREKTENWQHLPDDPDCIATREAMKDIMRFWLSHGCDGFRVDMADSLVKEDDENKSATCAVWRDLLTVLDDYPEAAVVAEWSNPDQAVAGAGFDMDFILDHPGNCYHRMMRDYRVSRNTPAEDVQGAENIVPALEDHSYFKAESDCVPGDFLPDLMWRYAAVRGGEDTDLTARCAAVRGGEDTDHGLRRSGHLAWITCNHDTPRPSHNLTVPERKLAYAVLMTLPGVPFLYYGDEIGMRYQQELPTKEGGYTRTGSRTPMQWDNGPNKGFSQAGSKALYLPVDSRPDAPDVRSQEGDPDSLLETFRSLTALKAREPGLLADACFETLVPAGYNCETGSESGPEASPDTAPETDNRRIWIYRRGDLLIAVNPSGQPAHCTLPGDRVHIAPDHREPVFKLGDAELSTAELPAAGSSPLALHLGPQSFSVWRVMEDK